MNKVLELREKRAKLWDSTKAFLDNRRNEKGLLSGEDTQTYERMEADVMALGKEIERLERQAVLDLELAKPTTTPITSKPYQHLENDKTGRASNAYKDAFWQGMRSKNPYVVQDALHIGTDSEGGFLVPDEFERTLVESLKEENIFRSLAKVIQTSSGDRKIPIAATKGTASWIDEEGAIPESDDTFGLVSIGAYKLATMIKVSEELLNDAFFNLPQYIAKEFARRIGAKEEEAFFIGDGVGKPTGIFNETGGGEIGVTAGAAAIKVDDVMDLFYSLKAPYRKKAVFLTNDSTVKAIRKLKDSNGQYLWQPSLTAGEPDRILNRPIKTSSYVPQIGETGSKVMAFGDFGYYWIADRQGRSLQRLNELFATTGQVGFKATQRVDGKIILPEAVKILQMS